MSTELDHIDAKIIALLKHDAKLNHKQIGQRVHRTGQAVGARIAHLIEQGIIHYTIQVKQPQQQFIRLILSDSRFVEVEKTVSQFEQVDACYKIAGDACYLVIAHFDAQQLSQFIDIISEFCHYSVNTVVRQTL